MVKLLCHSIYQKAELFKITPTKANVQDEFALYLENCVICNMPILEIRRVDIWGNIPEPVRLRTKNIKKFLDSMDVLWKPTSFNPAVSGSRFYLGYNEYGTKKKCFQNLSNILVGKIETDPYLNLNSLKKDKICVDRSSKQLKLIDL